MSKNNYRNLRDLRQVREARARVDAALNMARDRISDQYKFLKVFYTPINLFNRFVDSVAPVLNVFGFVAELWRRFREAVNRRDEKNDNTGDEEKHE